MAKKGQNSYTKSKKTRNKGVHAKNKCSRNKASENYKRNIEDRENDVENVASLPVLV